MNTSAKYQIILDRDSRYDGVFFLAVKTTGIVCLPSCPAMCPLEKNAEFYDQLEDALAAGYRVCKRCKPERFTAGLLEAKALLDSENTSAASKNLGISDRHLRRLTKKQIGTSPHKLLIGKRILTAKNLLSGTKLPIIDIAFSSGFQSLRQFNASFKEQVGQTSTQFRGKQTPTIDQPAPGAIDLTLRLPFQKPLQWEPLKQAFLMHAVPGLEEVSEDGTTLTRLVKVAEGRFTPVTIDLRPPTDFINVTTTVTRMSDVDEIVRTIKRVFDLEARPDRILAALGSDPLLGRLVHEHPGLRVCGMFDPYELLINTIIGQLISIPAARTFSERLVKSYGQKIGELYVFPTAETLLKADPLEMYQRTRINHKKIATIQAVCQLLVDGFDLTKITTSEKHWQKLLSVKGIGSWTVEYVALRGLGDPDGFPADDLFIKRRLGVKNAREAEQIAEKWRPYRGYATQYLWSKGGNL